MTISRMELICSRFSEETWAWRRPSQGRQRQVICRLMTPRPTARLCPTGPQYYRRPGHKHTLHFCPTRNLRCHHCQFSLHPLHLQTNHRHHRHLVRTIILDQYDGHSTIPISSIRTDLWHSRQHDLSLWAISITCKRINSLY